MARDRAEDLIEEVVERYLDAVAEWDRLLEWDGSGWVAELTVDGTNWLVRLGLGGTLGGGESRVLSGVAHSEAAGLPGGGHDVAAEVVELCEILTDGQSETADDIDLDVGQCVADFMGLLPLYLGVVSDLVNGAISVGRGNWTTLGTAYSQPYQALVWLTPSSSVTSIT